ncbi:MAG TPA: hypothetical protein VGW38_22725 [Chloroflexota bacterium]|nr:hypothetical protein [Chloroflexota bacterium]
MAVVGCSRPVEEAQGSLSALSPGQPLHCSGIERLGPVAAEEELVRRGYRVSWQYFDGPDMTSRFERPPGDAVVLGIDIRDGNEAHVLAEPFDPRSPHHRRIRAGDTMDCD